MSIDVCSDRLVSDQEESPLPQLARVGRGTVWMRFSASVQAAIEGLAGPVAVVGEDWRILAFNRDWTILAVDEESRRRLSLGRNFRDYWLWSRLSGNVGAEQVVAELDQFDFSCGRQLHLETPGVSKDEHWRFAISGAEFAGGRYAVVSRADVSELFRLRSENRALNLSLMEAEARVTRAHEDERTRVARDLHDSAAQHLIGMNLVLTRMRMSARDDESTTAIADLSILLGRFQRELRGLTFMLHPPEIDKHGLHGAIFLMCEGFAKRTGLQIETSIYGNDFRSTSLVEGAAYRVVQEALSNVHRHAHASRVRVRISDHPAALHLSICDDGCGLQTAASRGDTPEETLGFGIAGMIGRVAELGGVLRVRRRRGPGGTIVLACLPRIAAVRGAILSNSHARPFVEDLG
jgi:signal transduction histidine kinase